jgi:hypothetical protein
LPDPKKQTISATEAPGLFNVSPYVTRWMLWQKFARGVEIDASEDSRMSWGKKMQPLLIEQAADDLKLEVRPNEGDVYHRRGLLGCTRDATIICPDRGPGALETKCVFDYRVWMEKWNGGKNPPKEYEIQLQQQMLVGDPNSVQEDRFGMYRWGVIAAWVCGEMHYFEREPIYDLWERVNDEAKSFFDSVIQKREPDPFGAPIEIEWLTKLLPTVEQKVINLVDSPLGREYVQIAKDYQTAKALERENAKIAEPLRAKLLALAKDAQEVWLPEMIRVQIGGSVKAKRLNIFIPENTLMAG